MQRSHGTRTKVHTSEVKGVSEVVEDRQEELISLAQQVANGLLGQPRCMPQELSHSLWIRVLCKKPNGLHKQPHRRFSNP